MASLMTMLLLACSSVSAKAGKVPPGFTEHDAEVNGVRIHYSIGGKGSPVVLLHGYAQTSHMWNPVMPLLARNHTVIVPDLRGMGLSAHPETGYTKKNQGVDIAGVVDHLKIRKADLVTHDIGNMVGYALAAQYPTHITRWVVIDAPLPGIGDWDHIVCSPQVWHFNFRGPDEEQIGRAHV